jgi:vacuolar iron transporter family protein
MNKSIKRGLFFGLTSAVITTLGLMMGLYSSSADLTIIIVGIITIAIADSLSDAFGIHVSEETFIKNHKNVWLATFATLLTKIILTLTFIVPFLIFEISRAIIVNISYGLLLLIVFNYYLAKSNHKSVWKTITEHLLIAIIVLFLTYFVGKLL